MRKCFVLKFSYFCLENGVCFLDIVEHNHYGVPQGSVPNLLINIINSLLHNHYGVPQGSIPNLLINILNSLLHNHYGVPQGSVSNLLINILNSLFKGTLSVILGDPPCRMTMPNSQWYPYKLCLIKFELDINI